MTAPAKPGPGRRRLAVASLALVALSLSCAAPRRISFAGGAPLSDHPRIALLPLENLSGAADAGDALTRLLGAELSSRGWCDLVDIGQVQGAMRTLRARNAAALSLEQLAALGDTLRVRYVLTGSLLEHKIVNTDDGPTPAVAVTLKLLDPTTGRIVWAKAIARSGRDRETVFGYGRQDDPLKLDAVLVDEMLADFGRLAGAAPAAGGKGKK